MSQFDLILFLSRFEQIEVIGSVLLLRLKPVINIVEFAAPLSYLTPFAVQHVIVTIQIFLQNSMKLVAHRPQ